MFRSIVRLEAYCWVARLGSFQAAAEHLGLSQPSISIRVKELENHAKTALFIRDNRGARLTDQGRAMFGHVEAVITLLHDLNGHFGRTGTLSDRLRAGVPDSFALCCLSPFMRLVKQQYPELNVAINVDNSHSLARKLEENHLDIAILAQAEISSAFRVESLGHQNLVWVASPEISLPSRVLKPEDLSCQRIFTNPSPSPSFAVLVDWFAERGLMPPRINTCNSIAAIVVAVMGGQGISALPACVVQQKISEGALVAIDVSPPLPKQEMFAAYLRGIVNPGMKQTITLMREAIAGTGFVEAV